MYALLPVQEGGSTAIADASRETSPGAGTDMSLGIMPASLWRAHSGRRRSKSGALNVARRAAMSSFMSSLSSSCRRRFVVDVVDVVLAID
jgi:hypothetical protein